MKRHPYIVLVLAGLVLGLSGCYALETGRKDGELRWWKGNLHTHSLWSDGDDYPEMIMSWYKQHGYQFTVLSDHNTLANRERWIDVAGSKGGMEAYERYLAYYGDEWVEQKQDSVLKVRLKTLEEYRPLFEEPNRFLIIQSEEISDRFEQKPIHINATNVKEHIEPQGGNSVLEVMQNNVDAVLEQRQRTGQPMFPHINHPNFGWAVTAHDLIALEGERFFEVYNGHPFVHNEGDSLRPSTERMWDFILTERISHGASVMYGLATDDAHNYHTFGADQSNPGRGWVMVQAEQLTPEALIAAMEAGRFYATTGVILEDLQATDTHIALKIQPRQGVTYTTQFIGTRKGHEAASLPAEEHDMGWTSREGIGTVLAEVQGLAPSYRLQGDEYYVRAKVISSRKKENPYREGEYETAWIQPVVPGRR